MRTSETTKNIAPAVTAASNAITGAKKDGKNPHYKSTYATLSSVINASNKPLVDNDLSIQQELGRITKNQTIIVVTRLTHGESSEWYETDTEAPLKNKDIHVLMSTFTYCRRNAISALLNMPVDDDDGNKSHDAKAEKIVVDLEPMLIKISESMDNDSLEAVAKEIRNAELPTNAKAKLRKAWTEQKSILIAVEKAEA
jgi:hypothetical protein